jgi:hypothetical protein
MTCKLCIKRGKPWQGSDPKCAFDSGTFSPDNWGCATMLALREKAMNPVWREDEWLGVIPMDGCMFMVLQWSKSRGKTNSAKIITDGNEALDITETDALDALEDYVDA